MSNFFLTNLVASPPATEVWPSLPANSQDGAASGSINTSAVLAGALATEVHPSITAFEPGEWNALVPRDEPQLRHDVLRAAEESGLVVKPRYIAVRRAGRLAGIGVANQSEIDLLLLAAPSLKRAAARLRRGPFKRLGVLRALSCGPVITNCRPNLYLDAALPEAERADVARDLVRRIDALPGGALRVAFELAQADAQTFGPALEACGYIQAASLPGTRLKIDAQWNDFEAYVAAMRKFYRRAIRHDQELGRGLDIRIEANFGHLADEAYALYAQVLERAETVLERLTPAYFKALSTCEDARLVTARERSTGKLIGIELLLLGENVVQDLYTGVDYALNARYNTYFNLIYPGIALACSQGVPIVSTGQTSYEFKSRLGVEAFPLYVFIKHRNRLVNALLHRFHRVICPDTPTFSHQVFRAPEAPRPAAEPVA